jgi:hypothetical protein
MLDTKRISSDSLDDFEKKVSTIDVIAKYIFFNFVKQKMKKDAATLSITTLSITTQHRGTQHNNTEHNDTQYNDT